MAFFHVLIFKLNKLETIISASVYIPAANRYGIAVELQYQT